MIVYKDYLEFIIMNDKVNIISDETDYGRSTVAEINNQYYYLGDDSASLAAAILAWQDIKGRELTNDELSQVLKDNSLSTDTL